MLPPDTGSPGRRRNRIRYGECFPVGDLTYVPISKNGSSAILVALWETYGRPPPTVWYDDLPTEKAVVMLRDPTLRLWSAYQWLRRPSRGEPDPQAELPWEEWVNSLTLTPDLSHALQPQSSWLVPGPTYTFVRWDFPEIARLLGVTLGHQNKRQVDKDVPDITPEMQYYLNDIYGADYKIWESIA